MSMVRPKCDVGLTSVGRLSSNHLQTFSRRRYGSCSDLVATGLRRWLDVGGSPEHLSCVHLPTSFRPSSDVVATLDRRRRIGVVVGSIELRRYDVAGWTLDQRRFNVVSRRSESVTFQTMWRPHSNVGRSTSVLRRSDHPLHTGISETLLNIPKTLWNF